MGEAMYVRARYMGRVDEPFVQIPHRKRCDHVSAICLECADIWSVDWELFAATTASGRWLRDTLNKTSPDIALMNGEIAWRK
jgi:hypothetical protein